MSLTRQVKWYLDTIHQLYCLSWHNMASWPVRPKAEGRRGTRHGAVKHPNTPAIERSPIKELDPSQFNNMRFAAEIF